MRHRSTLLCILASMAVALSATSLPAAPASLSLHPPPPESSPDQGTAVMPASEPAGSDHSTTAPSPPVKISRPAPLEWQPESGDYDWERLRELQKLLE